MNDNKASERYQRKMEADLVSSKEVVLVLEEEVKLEVRVLEEVKLEVRALEEVNLVTKEEVRLVWKCDTARVEFTLRSLSTT